MARNWKRFCLVLSILLVLVLAVLLTMILTKKPDPAKETEPTESTPAPTIAEPISLEEAVSNLASANSLQLTISMLNKTDSYSYDTHYRFRLSKDTSGTQTILYSQLTAMTMNGETIESPGDQAYYQGNLAYIHYVYGLSGHSAIQYIRDKNYDLGQVLEEQTGFYQKANGNAMLEVFSSLSPVCIPKEDGSVSYQLWNIEKETFSIVYGAFAGEAAAEELVNTLIGNCMFNIYADIDPQGYLCQFKLEILNVHNGTQTQNITILFSVDEINTADKLNQPEYVKNFSITDNTQIVYIHNNITAHYYYRSGNTNLDIPNGGFIFSGFGEAHSDNYTVESYQVLTQIGDIPVTEIRGILNNKNCSVKVERLVIPVGVAVNIQGVYSDTTFVTNTENTALYFLDREENVKKTFLVAGQSSNNPETVYFLSACYADQWDYVDGIPTPKN